MNIKVGYSIDDVMLKPKLSKISSRSLVDTSVDLGKGVKLSLPLITSNMKTIAGLKMARAISDLGGLGLLHRFMPHSEIVGILKELLANAPNRTVGGSVGAKEEDKTLVDRMVNEAGCKIICVDLAHGHSKICFKMTEWIAKKYPQVLLISGNVSTGEGAKYLHNAGADAIRVGQGSGSLCTTRVETGNGVAQMTALSDCFNTSFPLINNARKFKIIADGGIKNSGDAVKCLVYSDAVMVGRILAGTEETPVEAYYDNIDGCKYKAYEGSSTHKNHHIEGVKTRVPYKGPVAPVIENFMQGIRSGCSYQGAENLEQLKENPEFIQISSAGWIESQPHIHLR